MNKIVVFFMLCFSISISAIGNPFAEQISGGNVSEKIEHEIKDIFKILRSEKYPQYPQYNLLGINYKKKLIDYYCKEAYFWSIYCNIRKTSAALIEHIPSFVCGGFDSKYNYLYVNEDFYNLLTRQEKKYWIIDAIDSQIYNRDNNRDLSSIEGISFVYKFMGFFAGITGLFGTLFQSKGDRSAKEVLYISSGVYGSISFILFLMNKIAFNTYCNERSRFYIDKEIIARHNCLDEAVSFLQKVLDNSNLLSLSEEEYKNVKARLDNLKK